MSHIKSFLQINPADSTDFKKKAKDFLADYPKLYFSQDLDEIQSSEELDDFEKELYNLAEKGEVSIDEALAQAIQKRKEHFKAIKQISCCINEIIHTEAEYLKRTRAVVEIINRNRQIFDAVDKDFVTNVLAAYNEVSKDILQLQTIGDQSLSLANIEAFVNNFNIAAVQNKFIKRVQMLAIISHNYKYFQALMQETAAANPGLSSEDKSLLDLFASCPMQRLSRLQLLATSMLTGLRHFSPNDKEKSQAENIKRHLESFFRKMKRVNETINKGFIAATNEEDGFVWVKENGYKWDRSEFNILLPIYQEFQELLNQSALPSQEPPVTDSEVDQTLAKLKVDNDKIDEIVNAKAAAQNPLSTLTVAIPAVASVFTLAAATDEKKDSEHQEEAEAKQKAEEEARLKAEAEEREAEVEQELREKARVEVLAEVERNECEEAEVRQKAEEKAKLKAEVEQPKQEQREHQVQEETERKRLEQEKLERERAAEYQALIERARQNNKQREADEHKANEDAERARQAAASQQQPNTTPGNAKLPIKNINIEAAKQLADGYCHHLKKPYDDFSKAPKDICDRHEQAASLSDHLNDLLLNASEQDKEKLNVAVYDLIQALLTEDPSLDSAEQQKNKLTAIGNFERDYCHLTYTGGEKVLATLKTILVITVGLVLGAAIAASAAVIIAAAATGVAPPLTIAGITACLTTNWSIYAASGGAILGTIVGAGIGIKSFFFPQNLPKDLATSARKYVETTHPQTPKASC